MTISISALRQFVALAESGSMSRAAESLALTQPALSYSVRRLEESYGAKLLLKEGAQFILTDAGRLLRNHARKILRSIDRAVDDMSTSDRITTAVSLGITSGLADILSMPLVEEASRLFPNVMLTVREAPSGPLLDSVAAGVIDLAICFVPKPMRNGASQKILEHDYHLCGDREAILDLRLAEISVREVCQHPLVMMDRRNGQRFLLEAEAARQGLSLNVVAEIDSSQSLRRAVIAGLGFSIFTKPSLRKELSAGMLLSVPIVEPRISRPLFISTGVGSEHRPWVAEIRRMAFDVVRSVVGPDT